MKNLKMHNKERGYIEIRTQKSRHKDETYRVYVTDINIHGKST